MRVGTRISIRSPAGDLKGAIHCSRFRCKVLYIHTVIHAMSALPKHVESIHPALWRGSQLARAYGKTVDTGYAALSAELPGGGWPLGALVELLVQQPGVGEMRLLRPALAELSRRPVALLQARRTCPIRWRSPILGLPLDKLMQLRAPKTADALWCAEQVLRARSCGALVFWQQHIRAEALRRLHLAAQATETLLILVRPLASAAGCVAGHVTARRATGRWRHRRRRRQATRTDTKRDTDRRPATLTDSAEPLWPCSSPFTCPGFRWRYSVRGGRLGRSTAASCWSATRSSSLDAVAREAGVLLGMKRGGVMTLAPEALVYDRAPAREHDMLREVALALMRFSPQVAVCEEETVVVDVIGEPAAFRRHPADLPSDQADRRCYRRDARA